MSSLIYVENNMVPKMCLYHLSVSHRNLHKIFYNVKISCHHWISVENLSNNFGYGTLYSIKRVIFVYSWSYEVTLATQIRGVTKHSFAILSMAIVSVLTQHQIKKKIGGKFTRTPNIYRYTYLHPSIFRSCESPIQWVAEWIENSLNLN